MRISGAHFCEDNLIWCYSEVSQKLFHWSLLQSISRFLRNAIFIQPLMVLLVQLSNIYCLIHIPELRKTLTDRVSIVFLLKTSNIPQNSGLVNYMKVVLQDWAPTVCRHAWITSLRSWDCAGYLDVYKCRRIISTNGQF